MSGVVVGILGIVFLLLLLVAGMPVAFALALAGFLGVFYFAGMSAAMHIIGSNLWLLFSNYSYAIIPLFIFMGMVAFQAGVSKNLYDTAYKWLGSTAGGLAMATTVASAGFAAICGSASATVATLGVVALPEMRKHGYDDALATGVITATGSALGPLIPPSIVLIVYGIITEQSIGQLLLAGVLPGILLAALFIGSIYVRCRLNPKLGPPGPPTTFRKKLASLPDIADVGVLFLLVMGGILLGWFTATEAAAVGAGGALLIALLRRKLNWQGFKTALLSALPMSCMVVLLVGGGVIFGRFIALSRIPFMVADWAVALPIPPLVTLVIVMFIFIIGGCLMDSMAFLIIAVPIFLPVAQILGYDPVWFGVIVCLLTTLGVITPPVGACVFVMKGIAPDVPIETIFRGSLFFVTGYAACMIFLIAFPQIILFLPGVMMK